MALVEFDHVAKAFEGVRVLDNVTFSVNKGEIFCILGPSGTGKSVTLRHLVRLLTPTGGHVYYDGIDVGNCSEADLAKVRRRVGFLFQGAALLAWMTVRENVALPLQEEGRYSDEEIEQRVDAALESVGLLADGDKYPNEISGGMQKRAGLARAVVLEPETVLYDEPTSGLDPVTSAHIHALIRQLNHKLNITSIIVTHDLTGALAIADRLALIADGRVVAMGTPQEFVQSKEPIVQDFLSAMKGVKNES